MNPYQPGEDNQDPYMVGYKAGAASRDAEIAELTGANVLNRNALRLQKEKTDQLREQVKMLQSAIKNLRDVKGRHHSEIAYKRLIEALTATEQKP